MRDGLGELMGFFKRSRDGGKEKMKPPRMEQSEFWVNGRCSCQMIILFPRNALPQTNFAGAPKSIKIS